MCNWAVFGCNIRLNRRRMDFGCRIWLNRGWINLRNVFWCLIRSLLSLVTTKIRNRFWLILLDQRLAFRYSFGLDWIRLIMDFFASWILVCFRLINIGFRLTRLLTFLYICGFSRWFYIFKWLFNLALLCFICLDFRFWPQIVWNFFYSNCITIFWRFHFLKCIRLLACIHFWSLINLRFFTFFKLILGRLLHFSRLSTIFGPLFWRSSWITSFRFNFKVWNFSVYLQIQFDFFGLSWTIFCVNILWPRSNFSFRLFKFFFLFSSNQINIFLHSTDWWFFIRDRRSSDSWLVNKAWYLSRKRFLLRGTDFCLNLVFSCY